MSLRLGQGPTGLTVRLDRGNASTLTAVKDGGQLWAADVSLQFGTGGDTVSFPATVDGGNAVWDLTAADVMTILRERPEWPLKEAGPFACRIIEAGNTVAAGQCTIGDGWTADHSSPHVIWSGATPRPGPQGDQGPQGVGVESASVSSGDLVLTLTDESTINAGQLPAAQVTDAAVADVIGATETKAALDATYLTQAGAASNFAPISVTPRTGTRAVGQDELTRNVKDYGAIGDGASHKLADLGFSLSEAQARWPGVIPFDADPAMVEVDWCAIQYCVKQGGKVFIPAGDYLLWREVMIPSNTSVSGAGIDKTILRPQENFDYLSNLLTNARNNRHERDITQADTHIYVSDLTLDGRDSDGNWSNIDKPTGPDYANRFGITKRKSNGNIEISSSACNLAFSTVTDSLVERVKSVGYRLHGFAVDASEYNDTDILDPGDDTKTFYQPGPSQDVTIRDCIADSLVATPAGGQDDPFTCHWSDRVTFDNCRALNTLLNGGTPSAATPTGGSWTSNGLEVDEGSRDCVVRNCYVYGYQAGVQTKGHSTSRPAVGTLIEGCVFEACTKAIDIEWTYANATSATYASVPFPIARDVTVRNCLVKNGRQNYFTGDSGKDFPELRAIDVRGYTGVTIESVTIQDYPTGGGFYTDWVPGLTVSGLRFINAWTSKGADNSVSAILMFDRPIEQSGITIENVDATASGGLATRLINIPSTVVRSKFASLAAKGKAGGDSAVVTCGPDSSNTYDNIAGTGGFTTDIDTGSGTYKGNFRAGSATDWETIPLTSGWTGTLRAKRYGNLVTVNALNITAPSGVSGNVRSATLPAKYRPPYQVSGCLARDDGAAEVCKWLNTSGGLDGPFTAGKSCSGTFTYLV